MSASYLQSIYLANGNESYEDWKILVDDTLEKYKIYATKPEERIRMIKKRPILRRFKRAYE